MGGRAALLSVLLPGCLRVGHSSDYPVSSGLEHREGDDGNSLKRKFDNGEEHPDPKRVTFDEGNVVSVWEQAVVHGSTTCSGACMM